ncbi:MAG: hypothetical protein Q8O26_14850 [Phreatobacter sp.]|uniref:hypothetical protein n=1 Tax=Phreatobacter sp. TaxID=1966341 RepID=UPI0027351C08|nr:hypothetical protein [Phreatobacter sp.]MDP2803152.1 hypothetical protein [Phreatobacter sp.]
MFRILAVATAAITLFLGFANLLAGQFVAGRWALAGGDGVIVLSRRIGALYIGLAVIFILARNAPPSALRRALCVGTGLACILLASLGTAEWLSGRVSAGILSSVVVEAVLGSGFLSCAIKHESRSA